MFEEMIMKIKGIKKNWVLLKLCRGRLTAFSSFITKEEQIKPKERNNKEGKSVKLEINCAGNEQCQSWFFEKFNKTEQCLSRFNQKEITNSV